MLLKVAIQSVIDMYYIGDVICENLPYGGTNSIIRDLLYSHVCDSNYAQGATKTLAVDVH